MQGQYWVIKKTFSEVTYLNMEIIQKMFQMCTGGDDWWHNKFIYTLILKKIRHCF